MIVYGIKSCDTCRKALKFLTEHGAAHEAVDLRQTPPSAQQLSEWLARIGVETLINTRSTTWRQLEEPDRARIMAGDVDLLATHITLIKRPLVDWGEALTVGFNSDQWQARL